MRREKINFLKTLLLTLVMTLGMLTVPAQQQKICNLTYDDCPPTWAEFYQAQCSKATCVWMDPNQQCDMMDGECCKKLIGLCLYTYTLLVRVRCHQTCYATIP